MRSQPSHEIDVGQLIWANENKIIGFEINVLCKITLLEKTIEIHGEPFSISKDEALG